MEVKEGELKIWHDLLEPEARRESIDHWAGELSGHAKALYRVGLIDEKSCGKCLGTRMLPTLTCRRTWHTGLC